MHANITSVRQPAIITIAFSLILSWNCISPKTAQAEMTMQEACQVIADAVCGYLTKQGETSVMIGHFRGGNGPIIERMLKFLIEKKGFDTKDGLTLEGR